MAASVMAATCSRAPARSASISMTSPWIRVESTSNTMSRLARRSRLLCSTAMSTGSSVATCAMAVCRSTSVSRFCGTVTRSSRPVTG
ncbi:Uncharacterised protein [Mycobacteroides abscessus subsp. abscessus]|nr:Uncharacterised protein [Mycobacteroides abscessus subsp. abscessus]